jgi:hypothetical protein
MNSQTYLTTQDVSKRGERVVHGLIINTFIQVFYENVANTRLAKRRISLRPHDANGTSFYHVKIHGVQSSLGYNIQVNHLKKQINLMPSIIQNKPCTSNTVYSQISKTINYWTQE